MVYATCSFLPQENEAVVADFLAEHPEFAMAAPAPAFGEAADTGARDGWLRLAPHRHGTDAFCAVTLLRRSGEH